MKRSQGNRAQQTQTRRVNLVLLVALTAALLWIVLGPLGAAQPLAFDLQQAAQGLDEYDYQLVFSPEERQLDVTLNLRATNREDIPWDALVIRTYAGAFDAEDTSPAAIPELRDAFYPDGFSAGGLSLLDVQWNGLPVQASFDDRARTVLRVFIPPLRPGASGELKLRCVLTVPHSAGRYGEHEGIWSFGNALPVLAMREANAWRADPYWPIGDPFVSRAANWRISLTMPEGYTWAGSAPLDTRALALRDFAFVLARDAIVRENTVHGIRLRAVAHTPAAAQEMLRLSEQALRFFNGRYGLYPWPALTVCETPFPMGGMEYPGLVIVTDAYLRRGDKLGLEVTLAHEIAHQWFYALVGSDQINQPWQDEALSEHAAMQYIKAQYGAPACEALKVQWADAATQHSRPGITPASPLPRFAGYKEYSAVVYGRGAALLDAIERETGRAEDFLRTYCQQFAFAHATREDFDSFLCSFMSRELRPLVNEYLDASMP